jgi:hypothetical protein
VPREDKRSQAWRFGGGSGRALLTRWACFRLSDINKNCLEEFRAHWNCLENNNHQLWQCRRPERVLNRCVFQKIVRSRPRLGGRMSCLRMVRKRVEADSSDTGPRENNTRHAERADARPPSRQAIVRGLSDGSLAVGERCGDQEEGRNSAAVDFDFVVVYLDVYTQC